MAASPTTVRPALCSACSPTPISTRRSTRRRLCPSRCSDRGRRSRAAWARRSRPSPTSICSSTTGGCAIRPEWNELVLSATVQSYEQRRQLLQADVFAVTQVENLAFGFRSGRSQQQRLDHVIDVIKIASLLSAAKNVNGFASDQIANPNPKKRLPSIFNPHARSISVSQTQRTGPNFVNAVVK